jgi:copper(I)-binding protein
MRLLATLTLATLITPPGSAAAPSVQVSGWARPTVPGQSVGAAYLTIRNKGAAPDRLLALGSPAATSVSVHQTTNAGGISRMRPVGPIVIGPGRGLSMAPGGMHVMLMGLKAPLRPAARLPLLLRFERAGIVRTSLPIQMSAPDAGHASH